MINPRQYFSQSYFGRQYFSDSYYGTYGVALVYSVDSAIVSNASLSVSVKKLSFGNVSVSSFSTNSLSNGRAVRPGLPSLVESLSILGANARGIRRTNTPLSLLSSLSVSGKVLRIGQTSIQDTSSLIAQAVGLKPGTLANIAGAINITATSKRIARTNISIPHGSDVQSFAGRVQKTFATSDSTTTVSSQGKALRPGFVNIQSSALFNNNVKKFATGGFVYPLSTTYVGVSGRKNTRTYVSIYSSVAVYASGDTFHLSDGNSNINANASISALARAAIAGSVSAHATSQTTAEAFGRRSGRVSLQSTSVVQVALGATAPGFVSLQTSTAVTSTAVRYRIANSSINVSSNIQSSVKAILRPSTPIYSISQLFGAASRIRHGLIDLVQADSVTVAAAKRIARTNTFLQSYSSLSANATALYKAGIFVPAQTALSARPRAIFRDRIDVIATGSPVASDKAKHTASTNNIISTTLINARDIEVWGGRASIQVLSIVGIIGQNSSAYGTSIQSFSSFSASGQRIHVSGFNAFISSQSNLVTNARSRRKGDVFLSSFASLNANSAKIRYGTVLNANATTNVTANQKKTSYAISSPQSFTTLTANQKLTRRTLASVASSSVLQFTARTPRRIARPSTQSDSVSSLVVRQYLTKVSGPISIQDFSSVSVIPSHLKRTTVNLASLSNLTSNTKSTRRTRTVITHFSDILGIPNIIARPKSEVISISAAFVNGRRVRGASLNLDVHTNLSALGMAITNLSSAIKPMSTMLSSATSIFRSKTSIVEFSDVTAEVYQVGSNTISILPYTSITIRPRRALKITLGHAVIDAHTDVTVKGGYRPSEDSAILLVGF